MKDVKTAILAQIACADAVDSNFITLTKAEGKRILKLLEEQDSIISVLKSDLKETLEVVAERSNVVRCKDCKHGEPGDCGYGVDCDGVWHDDDWFCANGKQKDT